MEDIKETRENIKTLYENLIDDYLETFQIKKSGSVNGSNKNYEKIHVFFEKYSDLMRGLGLDLHEIETFQPIKFEETKKRNENRVKLIKLYGAANQLYLSSCRILRIQPDYNYINLMIIDSNDEKRVKKEIYN
jgi:hypothetical protein